MKIKKGDNVVVVSGKDRGRKGKVIRALPKESKVVVEGLNMRRKSVRPKRAGQKGQIVDIPSPMEVSNVLLICAQCGKATRAGYRVDGKAKARICKKCGAVT